MFLQARVSLTNQELHQRYNLHNVALNAAVLCVGLMSTDLSRLAVVVFKTPLKSADCSTVVRKAKVSGQLSWSGDCERCQSGCRSVSSEWTRAAEVTAESTAVCHDLRSPVHRLTWQRTWHSFTYKGTVLSSRINIFLFIEWLMFNFSVCFLLYI